MKILEKLKKVWLKIKENHELNYKVNLNTLEIHNLKNKHNNCHSELMTNYKVVNKKQMLKLIKKGYNGCRWCMPEYDSEK